MKLTKLSEIVSSGKQGFKSCECHYAWHQQTKGQNRQSFVLTIGQDTLKKARYREGDTCEIEIGESEIIITLGANLPFALNSRNRECLSKSVKVSSRGIETLQAIIPKKDRPIEMLVLAVETAKIRLAIPSQ